MESCPTQAVLPLVGLAAEKVIRDRYNRKHFGRAWRPVLHTTCAIRQSRLPTVVPASWKARRNSPPPAFSRRSIPVADITENTDEGGWSNPF
ncbi:MAG: hypothetical protein ACQESR_29480 [Planctomycetota bacterium]